MSKSYNNTINLSDTDAQIKKKFSSMMTDPLRVKLSDPGHADECNVFAYYSKFFPELKQEVLEYCKGAKKGCTECKKIFADNLIDKLKDFHKKREEFASDKKRVVEILRNGSQRAKEIASVTLKEVKELIGI